jgi:integrase
MKIHNDFTLYWRVLASGKRVVYYYAYDTDGVRQAGRSTGESNLTAARVVCNRLLKEGRLIPDRRFMPTFAEYAQGWWEWDTCEYLKRRRKRKNITRSYADNNKKMMNNRLMPYFKDMPLNKITAETIEAFINDQTKAGYKNTYINTFLGTLKTMLIEAVTKKVITENPLAHMEKLVNDRKAIKIITLDEFKSLFINNWKKVWDNDFVTYMANKLAALTGMRASEVLGLRGEFVFDDHIYLCAQYDEYGYRETKTKDKHNIPLPLAIIAELRELMKKSGDGFLFSLDGGAEPICRKTMYQNYLRALKRIGINRKEARSRGLSLHAWRHFLNTELQVAGVSVSKVQSVTGHKSDRMTEWYSHFDPKEFTDVREAQEALLQPDTKKAAGTKQTKQTPKKQTAKTVQAKKKQTATQVKPEKPVDRTERNKVIPFRAKETRAKRKQA